MCRPEQFQSALTERANKADTLCDRTLSTLSVFTAYNEVVVWASTDKQDLDAWEEMVVIADLLWRPSSSRSEQDSLASPT